MALIENDEDYVAFLKVVEKLIALDPEPETSEGQSLNYLADIVEKYEIERFPDLPRRKLK